MNADLMRAKLEELYRDSFVKALKIRTTKKNVILYIVQGETRTVVGKFGLAHGDVLAKLMAEVCRKEALAHLVSLEMAKLDEKKVEVNRLPETREEALAQGLGVESDDNDIVMPPPDLNRNVGMVAIPRPKKKPKDAPNPDDALAAFLGN